MNRITIAAFCLAAVLMTAGCVKREPVPDAGENENSYHNAAPSVTEEAAAPEAVADADLLLTAEAAEPENEPAGLAAVRQAVDDGPELCAVAYAGWHDPEKESIQACLETQDSPLIARYPDILEIPAERRVEYAGDDIYLIVPGSSVIRIIIEEYCPFGENGEEIIGEILYSADDCAPVLFSCNVSDLMENIRVILSTEDGEELVVSPMISLEDGSVVLPEGKVIDLTEYGR